MRSSRTIYTPLRYPGGKAKLANFLKLVLQENGLMDGHYAEPYAGGAGIACELLLQGYAQEVHINDIDPGVHAFWNAVLNQTEKLCQRISSVTLSVPTWKRQRNIQRKITDPTSFELGFSTFFLNRTNRSGIIKGGVIGGLDQTGNYKIDARFNRESLIKRIEKIAYFSDRVHLSNEDAISFLARIDRELPKKSLIYLDPPYYVKGGDLYKNFYKHSDHALVEEAVRALSQNWIVSYDNVPQIQDLYSWSRGIVYDLNYSAHTAGIGSEAMFFSARLKVPEAGNPSKVHVA